MFDIEAIEKNSLWLEIERELFTTEELKCPRDLVSWVDELGIFVERKFIGSILKGQLISKANCPVVNSSKKRTNEFVFTGMRRVFVRFFRRILGQKKSFRDFKAFYEFLLQICKSTKQLTFYRRSKNTKTGCSNRQDQRYSDLKACIGEKIIGQ